MRISALTSCSDDDRILVSLTQTPIWTPTPLLAKKNIEEKNTENNSVNILPTSNSSNLSSSTPSLNSTNSNVKQNLTEEEAAAQKKEEAELLAKGINLPLRCIFYFYKINKKILFGNLNFRN